LASSRLNRSMMVDCIAVAARVEPGTEDLVIDRCTLRECFGDGVRMLGAPGNNVRVDGIPGAALYVKESDHGSNTGWSSK
jgi:hypothetical protein